MECDSAFLVGFGGTRISWLVPPTPPPNVPPAEIRVYIIRSYYGKPMVNKPLIRPYYWGGTLGGVG